MKRRQISSWAFSTLVLTASCAEVRIPRATLAPAPKVALSAARRVRAGESIRPWLLRRRHVVTLRRDSVALAIGDDLELTMESGDVNLRTNGGENLAGRKAAGVA